jgi:hypothetical protein
VYRLTEQQARRVSGPDARQGLTPAHLAARQIDCGMMNRARADRTAMTEPTDPPGEPDSVLLTRHIFIFALSDAMLGSASGKKITTTP